MKSYDEIANSIFERRNKYVAKQKRKKRIIICTVTPAICCCIVLITSFGLWKNGFFSDDINYSDGLQNVSDKNSSVTNNQNNSSSGTSNSSNSSTTSSSDKQNSNESSINTPSNSVSSNPPAVNKNYYIDSVDKINFYSAKKIINEKSLLPIGTDFRKYSMPNILPLSNIYVEYPIDRNKVFTTTMVTYFTIELNDEKGFLAQKLGGTGLVEVVVTNNNIDDMGAMITFKREEKYYTCLKNGGGYDFDTSLTRAEFSSHKYIEGFNIVKNFEQENYKFTVRYEGSKVVGFECAPFSSTPKNYVADDVTFIEDFCVVLYTKQTFTIDELEMYFQNEKEDEALWKKF